MKTWERDEDQMRAADLRLRTSTTMYGPLQLTIVNHRLGSELGYEAGRAAYRDGQDDTVENLIQVYLAMPRYAPRVCTPRIVDEWRALFLIGWTSQLLEDSNRSVTDEPQGEHQMSKAPLY